MRSKTGWWSTGIQLPLLCGKIISVDAGVEEHTTRGHHFDQDCTWIPLCVVKACNYILMLSAGPCDQPVLCSDALQLCLPLIPSPQISLMSNKEGKKREKA